MTDKVLLLQESTILGQGFLSDGTPYIVRVLNRDDIPDVQKLDKSIEDQLTEVDRKFFYAHDREWYENFLNSGNEIIGLFNKVSGALISKANLTIDCTQLNPTGLNATSSLRRAYSGEFGRTGIVALLSGIGTDDSYRGRGAQSTILRALFKHALTAHRKVVLAAIVEPRNIPSLSILTGGMGMRATELNTHPQEKADYFLLSGILTKMLQHKPLAIPLSAVMALNGNVEEIRTKIRNKEKRIAVPLDIEDRHVGNLYNAKYAVLIAFAFAQGYVGKEVIHNNNYSPIGSGNGAKDYIVMDLDN